MQGHKHLQHVGLKPLESSAPIEPPRASWSLDELSQERFAVSPVRVACYHWRGNYIRF